MRRELKAKGERKSFRIALDLLIQVPDLHAIKLGEVSIEDDSLTTEDEDFRINFSRDNNRCLCHMGSSFSNLRSQIVISSFRKD